MFGDIQLSRGCVRILGKDEYYVTPDKGVGLNNSLLSSLSTCFYHDFKVSGTCKDNRAKVEDE